LKEGKKKNNHQWSDSIHASCNVDRKITTYGRPMHASVDGFTTLAYKQTPGGHGMAVASESPFVQY
jgi:hypothetical protein